MFTPDYPVETERLALRPLRAEDVDAVHAYQSLPDVVRYVPYEPRSRDEVLERVSPPRNSSTIDTEGDALLLAVELLETGQVIGDVMLAYRSAAHGTGEIGYIFHPDHAGHGYATEAAQALLRLGFEGLGLRRIIGRVDPRNTTSIGVLVRLGMWQESHFVQNEYFKGEWTDELDFAILRTEWQDYQER